MSLPPPIIATDRECLAAVGRGRDPKALRPVVERYLALVYSMAFRRTNDPVRATEVTRAVFLVLARRARRLRKKTVLAGWLFHVTAVACRRAGVKSTRSWFAFLRSPRPGFPAEATTWTRLSGEIEGALERLSSARRNAVLLLAMLHWPVASASAILQVSEARAQKRAAGGLKTMARRVSRGGAPVTADVLRITLAQESCATPLPEGLLPGVLASIEESFGRRPVFKLARRTLNSLAWARWRRRVFWGVPAGTLALVLIVFTAWKLDARTGHSRSIATFLIWSSRLEGRSVPGLAQAARPWPAAAARTKSEVRSIESAEDLYQTTNLWPVHLHFSREQWEAVQPKRIGVLPNFFQPDGTVLLRNPEAQRSGLAGVLGFDFDWAQADMEFDGRTFTNVGSRCKGNGTYLGSLSGAKRSFKVDLNRFRPGQKLGGRDEFNFHNLINDYSCVSDALACEFFRDAGVPAPRTAYAWLTVSVDGQWDRKPLGLYAMIEPVDADFAKQWFGSKKAPVFKPVTYRLFADLGDHWPAYADTYDLKTQATPAQLRRVVEFARLVSHADDAEFGLRLGDFLDLEAFARFMAGQVLLSNYDGFLSNGQNFYVYLDPRTNRFGFIPWDMDLAWGSFFLLGSTVQRERASIWHPWVGENRLLERVMAVEAFRELYRARLEDFSARLFVPGRLNRRIDELAGILREPVAAESDFRLGKFEAAVGDGRTPRAPSGERQGANRPAHLMKHFIRQRAASVRAQLDGRSEGVILQRGPR